MKKIKQLQAIECLASGYYKLIDGRLYSRIKNEWRIMNGCLLPNNYRQILLYNRKRSGNSVRVVIYHHIAVYIMINGEYPEGYHIDHIDRNNQNDMPDNLRAVTAKDNIANTGQRRLPTEPFKTIRSDEIASIRKMNAEGKSQSGIAKALGLERLAVRYIIKRTEAGIALKYE